MAWLGVVIFVIGLMLSIGLHEVGHMVPAKRFGVRVPQYMVGFGPTIWSRRIGETEYGWKAIPLGGYVRLIGMYPPSRRRHSAMIEAAREQSLAEVGPDDARRTFYGLSVPRKLVVMIGGPAMNLVLGTLFFGIALSAIGSPSATTTIASVIPCVPTSANPQGIVSVDGSCGSGAATPAAVVGLKAGDQLISIAGTKLSSWGQLSSALLQHKDESVAVVVLRNGQEVTVNATPAQLVETDGTSRPFLGLTPVLSNKTMPLSELPAFMWQISVSSVQAIGAFPSSVYQMAKDLVTSAPRDASGPVSIIGVGRISGEIVAASDVTPSSRIAELLALLGSLNLFLGLFNLVPIPPLDGGHVAGALYEGIRRGFARIRRIDPLPGPADTARLLPIAYGAMAIMLVLSLVVMVADLLAPISLN